MILHSSMYVKWSTSAWDLKNYHLITKLKLEANVDQFFFFWLEVAKKRKLTSMDLFIYLFLLEVAKKWETNVKGLTTVKNKKKNKKTLMQIS